LANADHISKVIFLYGENMISIYYLFYVLHDKHTITFNFLYSLRENMVIGTSPKPNFLFFQKIIASFSIVQASLTLLSLIAIIVIATKRKQKSLVGKKATALCQIVYFSIDVKSVISYQFIPFKILLGFRSGFRHYYFLK